MMPCFRPSSMRVHAVKTHPDFVGYMLVTFDVKWPAKSPVNVPWLQMPTLHSGTIIPVIFVQPSAAATLFAVTKSAKAAIARGSCAKQGRDRERGLVTLIAKLRRGRPVELRSGKRAPMA